MQDGGFTAKRAFMVFVGILMLVFINMRSELSRWIGQPIYTIMVIVIAVMFIFAVGFTGLWKKRKVAQPIGSSGTGTTRRSWYLIFSGIAAVIVALFILSIRSYHTLEALGSGAQALELLLFLVGVVLIGVGLGGSRRHNEK